MASKRRGASDGNTRKRWHGPTKGAAKRGSSPRVSKGVGVSRKGAKPQSHSALRDPVWSVMTFKSRRSGLTYDQAWNHAQLLVNTGRRGVVLTTDEAAERSGLDRFTL